MTATLYRLVVLVAVLASGAERVVDAIRGGRERTTEHGRGNRSVRIAP